MRERERERETERERERDREGELGPTSRPETTAAHRCSYSTYSPNYTVHSTACVPHNVLCG